MQPFTDEDFIFIFALLVHELLKETAFLLLLLLILLSRHQRKHDIRLNKDDSHVCSSGRPNLNFLKAGFPAGQRGGAAAAQVAPVGASDGGRAEKDGEGPGDQDYNLKSQEKNERHPFKR